LYTIVAGQQEGNDENGNNVKVQSIKCFNSQNQEKQHFNPNEYGEYTQVKYVKFNHFTKGIITASDTGSLAIL